MSRNEEERFLGTVRLLLSPVQELVDHVDGREGRVHSRVGAAQMCRMSEQPEWLPISIVVSGKCRLHVGQSCRIIWMVESVGVVAAQSDVSIQSRLEWKHNKQVWVHKMHAFLTSLVE